MIILKPGNKLNPVTFSCSSCNCRYTANKIEYLVDSLIMNGDETVARVVKCCCPECGHVNIATDPVYGGEE